MSKERIAALETQVEALRRVVGSLVYGVASRSVISMQENDALVQALDEAFADRVIAEGGEEGGELTVQISATAYNHLYFVAYENEQMTPHRERVRKALEAAPGRKHSRGRVYKLTLSREDWIPVAEALDVRDLIDSIAVENRPEYRALATAHDRIMDALS